MGDLQKYFSNKMQVMDDSIRSKNYWIFILQRIILTFLHSILQDHSPELVGKTTVCQEFFKFLNTGQCSQALNQYITKDLYDTKFLQSIDEVFKYKIF